MIRRFVLDTNVLIHDPTALFKFQEHDVYLPLIVLEELDATQKGVSEFARNARQVSQFIEQLITHFEPSANVGIPLQIGAQTNLNTTGRLFFEPPQSQVSANQQSILGCALALVKDQVGTPVTVVSKDINLRIKARVLGIASEDYRSDKVLEDVNLLYSGCYPLNISTDEVAYSLLRCQQPNQAIPALENDGWLPWQCVYLETEPTYAFLVTRIDAGKARLRPVTRYQTEGRAVWGIHARNLEQNFALNLLLEPEVDFVSLVGIAGTGKTLLALAAGLSQTLEDQRYAEIIVTRATVPVGEDIGFLPGTEEEKMTPWMGALMDNLEVLNQDQHQSQWERAATEDLLKRRISIRSLNFMRGRTFLNKFVIVDEAQNLTPAQAKTLVTRAGPGTKMVFLGNIGQIDTPYVSETSSGLSHVVDRLKTWEHAGHITLARGERSRLADYAARAL